jgi:hypothetical protein
MPTHLTFLRLVILIIIFREKLFLQIMKPSFVGIFHTPFLSFFVHIFLRPDVKHADALQKNAREAGPSSIEKSYHTQHKCIVAKHFQYQHLKVRNFFCGRRI